VYDAAVIAEVESLAADERGVVLGLVASGAEAAAAARLAGPGRERCVSALAALARLPEDGRDAVRASLASALLAPLPEGLDQVHPGWIRRVLERESSGIVRAVARALPEPVRSVAAELLGARGESVAAPSPVPEGSVLEALRRGLFADLAPMPGAAGASTPLARRLCALPSPALLEEVDRRGASALGLALAGAADAVLARAAAGAGEPFARVVLAAAREPASPEARAVARALVASVPASEAARGAVRAVGLRAVARAIAPEGPAALAAVAQRLPPAVGDALLACVVPEAA
jgi:hypothetical protein